MSSLISLQSSSQRLTRLKASDDQILSTTNTSPGSYINDDSKGKEGARKPATLFSWKLMSIPAFFTAAYALNFLVDFVRLGDPAIIERIRGSVYGVSHILGGLTTMALGPFQFIPKFRKQNPLAHRVIGRVYMFGILIGGINAFYVSFVSLCRPIGQYAFAFLGLIWLVTGVQGMAKIWAGKIEEHRDWMTRNFSLTYAAVMLRWQLPLFISVGMDVEPALTLTGITCWLPNLIFAEWWIKRRYIIGGSA